MPLALVFAVSVPPNTCPVDTSAAVTGTFACKRGAPALSFNWTCGFPVIVDPFATVAPGCCTSASCGGPTLVLVALNTAVNVLNDAVSDCGPAGPSRHDPS